MDSGPDRAITAALGSLPRPLPPVLQLSQPPSARAVVVFVHGIFGSVATWGRFPDLLAHDPWIRTHFDLAFFTYSSTPRFGLRKAVPTIDALAQNLDNFLATRTREYARVVLVGHSQGGLIIQCFLARMVERGRAEELARIRRVILFACPNTGSEFALSLRRGLGRLGGWMPVLGNLINHAQEKTLRPYDEYIARNRSIAMNQVFRAEKFDTSHCPIAVVACAGTEDPIVTGASAHDTFGITRMLSGDHASLVKPATTSDECYEVLRQELEIALAEPIPGPPGVRTITVGGKSFLESSILCELFAYLLEESDRQLTVRRVYNAGETSNVCHALVVGDIDLYAEYTGTLLAELLRVDLRQLNDPALHTPSALNEQLKKHAVYRTLSAGGLIGFSNGYAVVMARSRAEQLGISTLSDLQRKSRGLRVRAHWIFYNRPDGLPGLAQAYGPFEFAAHDSGDHAQHYETLRLGHCDVVVGYSTDPEVAEPREPFVVLEDVLSYFGKYYAFPLFSAEARRKVPALNRVLGWLDGRIDDRKMSRLLREARELGLDSQRYTLAQERRLREMIRAFLAREGWGGAAVPGAGSVEVTRPRA